MKPSQTQTAATDNLLTAIEGVLRDAIETKLLSKKDITPAELKCRETTARSAWEDYRKALSTIRQDLAAKDLLLPLMEAADSSINELNIECVEYKPPPKDGRDQRRCIKKTIHDLGKSLEYDFQPGRWQAQCDIALANAFNINRGSEEYILVMEKLSTPDRSSEEVTAEEAAATAERNAAWAALHPLCRSIIAVTIDLHFLRESIEPLSE